MIVEDPAEWPKDEARDEARYFIELIKEGESTEYLEQLIEKTKAHWLRVFNDDVDFIMFVDTFNEMVSPYFPTKM